MSKIPGNRHSEIRIYADTTVAYLEGHLKDLKRSQAPGLRYSPRYKNEVRRITQAIEAKR